MLLSTEADVAKREQQKDLEYLLELTETCIARVNVHDITDDKVS